MDAMDAAAYPNDAEDGKSCGYLCDDYDERMQTPHLSRSFKEQELLQKILGLTKEQKKRARALRSVDNWQSIVSIATCTTVLKYI